MAIKKYELVNSDTIEFEGRKLYRIKAIRDIGKEYPKAGMLGGYIESEDNLSHEGDCWVSELALVYDKAQVIDNAKVDGNSRIFDNAVVGGNSYVYNNAKVYGNAKISGYSFIYGNAEVYGNAQVNGRAKVKKIKIRGEDDLDVVITPSGARIYGDVKVYGNASITSHPRISGDAELCETAEIYGDAHVKTGKLTMDIFEDFVGYVHAATGLMPTGEHRLYRLYKRVVKTGPGQYASPYFRDFTYRDGEVSEAVKSNEDRLDISGEGLHVALTAAEADSLFGDITIAVDVAKEDIIACAWGRLRVRKLTVVGQV